MFQLITWAALILLTILIYVAQTRADDTADFQHRDDRFRSY